MRKLPNSNQNTWAKPTISATKPARRPSTRTQRNSWAGKKSVQVAHPVAVAKIKNESQLNLSFYFVLINEFLSYLSCGE
jgi:hypothetical protein